MAVDTKSMRDLVSATPGDRMTIDKQHLHVLIDATPGDQVVVYTGQIFSILGAIDLGRMADQLAAHAGELRAMAVAA